MRLHDMISERVKNNPNIIEKDLYFLKENIKTPIGIIDALWEDKAGNYVVVEYKTTEKSDKIIGQITRYMGYVAQEYKTSKVRGIVLCATVNQRMLMAASCIPNLILKESQLIQILIKKRQQDKNKGNISPKIQEIGITTTLPILRSGNIRLGRVITNSFNVKSGDLVEVTIHKIIRGRGGANQ